MPVQPSLANRRSFLRSTVAFGSVAVGASFQALLWRAGGKDRPHVTEGYGPLRRVADETTGFELIQLPAGFRYLSYGWTGDPMADGGSTPGAHDGMAVIGTRPNGELVICRNHELSVERTPPDGAGEITYDRKSAGGCSTLRFDPVVGQWIEARTSLAGTARNCAGGPTPWGSWLSCEETVWGPGDKDNEISLPFEQTHGWIFEVPAEHAALPQPLTDMGRFVHEAVAVDPMSGYVYETEDRLEAGFYQFIPNRRGQLAEGGRLQMLKAIGRPDLRTGCQVGKTYDVAWVDIEDPTRPHSPGEQDTAGVFSQGKAQGATTFARLEGCWAGEDRIYFDATSGGDKGLGQIWQYDPRQQQLTLIFESPSRDVLDSPDNLAVSPRGGIILCEDGSSNPLRLHGLTSDGRLFPFAANNTVLKGERNGFKGDFRQGEWAGATFSPDGEWLFVNLQRPGITLAITGPWGTGLV